MQHALNYQRNHSSTLEMKRFHKSLTNDLNTNHHQKNAFFEITHGTIICWDPQTRNDTNIISPKTHSKLLSNSSGMVRKYSSSIISIEYQQEINDLAKQSAIAQKLKIPITSSKKLIQSKEDECQMIYFMIENFHESLDNTLTPKSNYSIPSFHNPRYTKDEKDEMNCLPTSSLIRGYVRVGKRSLYLHNPRKNDELVHLKYIPCILDFYVEEQYQRCGIGKQLLDTVFLTYDSNEVYSENTNIHEVNSTLWGGKPTSFAYDRPSDKMKQFLHRHYGLTDYRIHFNNFAIYDGFWNQTT